VRQAKPTSGSTENERAALEPMHCARSLMRLHKLAGNGGGEGQLDA